MKENIISAYENSDIKISVIEVSEFKFITTFWNKNDELEADREIHVFSTFGGASNFAFEKLGEYFDNEYINE